jgi:hypothetical protein
MGTIDSINDPENIDRSCRFIQYSDQSSDSSESEANYNISNLNPGDFEVYLDKQQSKAILTELSLIIDEVPQRLELTYDLKKDVIYPTGIYTGQFKGEKRHGIGIFQLGTGEKYHGSWKDDCPTGKGRLTNMNDGFYEGDFFNGRFFGRGVYESSHYKYNGMWLNDKQDGLGTEMIFFPEQPEFREVYQGSFRNGLRQGHGTLTIIRGDNKNVFNGQFEAGSMISAEMDMEDIYIQGLVVKDELRPVLIDLYKKNIKIEFENVNNFQGKVCFEDDTFIYFRLDERNIELITLLNDLDN